MKNEKADALKEDLEYLIRLRDNNEVREVSFLTYDHGYGVEKNVEIIKMLLNTMIMALEVQLRKARFGDTPQQLKLSNEYRAAQELGSTLNNYGFDPMLFAESIFDLHKTTQQTFFRMVLSAMIAMAQRSPRLIDHRNRASYRMCQVLAPIIREIHLPFI